MNWRFGIYCLLSAPLRNSLKSQRSPFAVYLHLSLSASESDGKSDGKIILRVLFRNFTVKPIRGTREALQITELWPLWIVELGKSLGFPSRANPDARSVGPSCPDNATNADATARGLRCARRHPRCPTSQGNSSVTSIGFRESCFSHNSGWSRGLSALYIILPRYGRQGNKSTHSSRNAACLLSSTGLGYTAGGTPNVQFVSLNLGQAWLRAILDRT